jgi:hypothetical protein
VGDIALTTATLAGAGKQALTVVLRIENPARVSGNTLLNAEEHAARIYDAIGVNTIWVHDEARDVAPGALRLTVILLHTDMPVLGSANEKLEGHVVGEAFREARRVYIFTNRIAALAAKHSRDRAILLGHAIAHEMGHVLLPANSHSASGLMSASLDMQSKTTKSFAPEQGALIRARLTAATVGGGTDSVAEPDVATR